MKKTITYVFAAIGLISVLYILCSPLFRVTGQTMFGSSAARYDSLQRGEIEEKTISTNQDAAYPAALGSGVNGSVTAQNNLPSTMSTASSPPTTNPISSNRMIIRNANVSLEVSNVNESLQAISQLANNSGGYVVSSSAYQGGYQGQGGYAQISIRIPATGFQNTLSEIKKFALKVNKEEVSGEDITQKYVDLQSTLQNLETAKAQLQKIMDNAKKTEDVLSVFRLLTDTQGQIDLVQGQIKYFKESVSLSLVNIDLQTKAPVIVSGVASWEIVKVAKEAYINLVGKLEDLSYTAITFIVYIPLILLWALIFLLVCFVVRKIYGRIKKIN